jgi:hypothetical protein
MTADTVEIKIKNISDDRVEFAKQLQSACMKHLLAYSALSFELNSNSIHGVNTANQILQTLKGDKEDWMLRMPQGQKMSSYCILPIKASTSDNPVSKCINSRTPYKTCWWQPINFRVVMPIKQVSILETISRKFAPKSSDEVSASESLSLADSISSSLSRTKTSLNGKVSEAKKIWIRRTWWVEYTSV